MTFEIVGEYNTATVYTNQSRKDCEDEALDQIQEIANAPAFEGDDNIAIMPDFHWGSGAVIGFTMPVKDKVVPNTIGVDIGCFHPDTMVDTLSGEKRIEDLADKDSTFGVYSCDVNGSIKVGEASAMKTRSNENLVEVTVDNGETIKCTPDHKFMLRNGEYKEAKDLNDGESLMPLYKGETEDGYTLVYDNDQNESYGKREHWMVARSELMEIPKNIDDMIIHHKDLDKKNNNPRNLEFMSRSDHSQLHAEMGNKFDGDNSDFEEKRIEALNDYWDNLSGDELNERIEISKENITGWMENNPEEFADSVSGNGERGKEYLVDFNTSERDCSICGDEFDNPASEYWHEVKEHPEETEYRIRENHSVESVTEIDETSDVYCLTVPEYGNFALSAGVIVHNCGMFAANFGDIHYGDLSELDREVRSRIPTGFDVHDRNDYHMLEDFPWEQCRQKLRSFHSNTDFDLPSAADIYDESYFEEVCNRVGYDQGRAINSMGTLGGGNHFIEFGRDEDDDLWCIIHSGSRGIGATIAEYWQDRATAATTRRQSIDDVPESVREYMNENWKPKADRIRDEFDGKQIQNKFDEVSQAIQEYGPSTADRNTDLDFLQGDEAAGYIIDMIFAQTYASESRREMMNAVERAMDQIDHGVQLNSSPWRYDEIESVHNYIDFEDGIIRKGACSARDGERLVVPFNMKYGTIIAEGKGNDAMNRSSAHGAGRAMSRTAAESQFTDADFSEQTDGVFMSETPMDEIPGAYKSPEAVEEALGESIEIVNRVTPILSIKAE